jgi:hypothetical protein
MFKILPRSFPLTNSMNRGPPEKLMATQLVRILHVFYGAEGSLPYSQKLPTTGTYPKQHESRLPSDTTFCKNRN